MKSKKEHSAVLDWEELLSPHFCILSLVSRLFRPSVEDVTRGLKALKSIDNQVDQLAARAKRGDVAATKALFYTAYESAIALNELALRQPESVLEISKKVPVWPVLSCDRAKVTEAHVAMFKSIELGSTVQVCDASQMFKQATTFRKWAFHLLAILVQMRKSLRQQAHLEAHQRHFFVHTNKAVSIPTRLLETVARLPKFSAREPQFKLWCHAVEALFRELTDDRFEEIAPLQKSIAGVVGNLVRNKRFNAGSKDAKNYGRSEILNRLRKAVKVAAQRHKATR